MFYEKKYGLRQFQGEHPWKMAWSQPHFRLKLFIAVALNISLLVFYPFFFQAIEQRDGMQMQDIVLANISATDVSLYIFILIWSMAVLTMYRAIQQPEILITFLFSFLLIGVSRVLTISLVPLDPPQDVIPLADPLTNTFYGGSVVTKDLFYSGHVSTVFLMFLCLKKKRDKYLTVLSAASIAVLVLVQHAHYTIDVVAAPVFSFFCFIAGKTIASREINFEMASHDSISN